MLTARELQRNKVCPVRLDITQQFEPRELAVTRSSLEMRDIVRDRGDLRLGNLLRDLVHRGIVAFALTALVAADRFSGSKIAKALKFPLAKI